MEIRDAAVIVIVVIGLFVYLKEPTRTETETKTETEIRYVVRERDPADVYYNPTVVPHQPRRHYDQLGYLKKDRRLLPLFGRPSETRRNRYNYYTIMNNTKVPLTHKERDSLKELGLEELYTDDSVKVFEDSYEVTIYKD
mgnify:CR=1 FL=1